MRLDSLWQVLKIEEKHSEIQKIQFKFNEYAVEAQLNV